MDAAETDLLVFFERNGSSRRHGVRSSMCVEGRQARSRHMSKRKTSAGRRARRGKGHNEEPATIWFPSGGARGCRPPSKTSPKSVGHQESPAREFPNPLFLLRSPSNLTSSPTGSQERSQRLPEDRFPAFCQPQRSRITQRRTQAGEGQRRRLGKSRWAFAVAQKPRKG
jgi:hypothetical protein